MGTPQSLSLGATQTLSGVAASTFNSNYAVYSALFIQTVYVFVGPLGVSPENIDITGIRDGIVVVSATPQRTHRLGGTGGSVALTTTSTVSTIVDYTIVIPNTASIGFASAQAAANQTQSVLTTAVATGNFTSQLQTLAVQNGQAPAFVNATVTAVSFIGANTTTIVISNDDNGDGSSSGGAQLTFGGRIGVIVGAGVVGVGILCAMVFYWLFATPAKYGVQAKSTERTREIHIYV